MRRACDGVLRHADAGREKPRDEVEPGRRGATGHDHAAGLYPLQREEIGLEAADGVLRVQLDEVIELGSADPA